jgi:hypothetical protein
MNIIVQEITPGYDIIRAVEKVRLGEILDEEDLDRPEDNHDVIEALEEDFSEDDEEDLDDGFTF